MSLPPMISAKALGAMPQFVLDVAGERRLGQALNASGLPYRFVEERTGYISEYSLATFVHEAARSAGQQNIGLLWAPQLTVADYGAWGQYVFSAPSLGLALRRASLVMPYHSSTDRAWLERAGNKSYYLYEFGLRAHRAYPDIGFSAIGVFLSIFRAYLGTDWKPDVVLLDFPRVPGWVEAEDTFCCPVIWNAPRLGLMFKSTCLLAETDVFGGKVGSATVQDIARERSHGPPKSFSELAREIVLHQIDRNEVSIDQVARSLNIGVRTLQRKLEHEGLKFRELVNGTRVARAKELLSGSTETVSGIASFLGYESANNFSRAFKKATGATPTEYRERFTCYINNTTS